jgi:UDP-N-acetylmuramoyl-L-alanyl-D-glutamate--2,6-diaminopimelate ligase
MTKNMQLGKLITQLSDAQIFGSTDLEIKNIVDNSRNAENGSLFIAVKGLTVDSHKFIPQVIESGAVAILGEEDLDKLDLQGRTYIKVKNSRHALGVIASEWFDNPSRKLKVIGVTGTEGKTSTSNLIYHIFQSAGKKAGLISTINAKIGTETIDTGLHVTNPEALPLQELLKKMVDEGCEYAILETTSIGLHQGRVAGVDYEVGALTNITSDHLDYHKTVEEYRNAKSELFKKVKIAILNKDDSSYSFIEKLLHKNTKIYSYGVLKNADIKAENIRISSQGMQFDAYSFGETVPFITKLIGQYNISNILAAVAVATSQNIALNKVQEAIESFKTPEGRLERIDEGQNFSVFVDFAHTANSVRNVLTTLKDITPKNKNLIAVYGSAGLRDAEKRPEMGEWGGKIANITIFTTDDPRTENVDDITASLVTGAEKHANEVSVEDLTKKHAKNVFTRINDRKQAFETAFSIAQGGDIIALLGKGHEKSLAIGNEEIPWSDQEVARELLKDQKTK